MEQIQLASGGTLTYYAREDWIDADGAREARHGYLVPDSQFRSIVLHHTVNIWRDQPGHADEFTAMRVLRTLRPDLGRDVPYHHVLFPQANPLDIVICEGRGWERTGAHASGLNSSTYGCALYGDFRNDEMTQGIVDGVRWIGAHIQNPRPTQGHRDSKATICPGDEAYAALPLLQPPFNTKANPIMDPTLTARIEELEAIIVLTKDPEELVDAAYATILHRKPDKAGRAHWIQFLKDGGSVAQMKALFEMSPEAQDG